ncbi:MAG: hypothetical protein B6242_11270 [Anaerolineaceae bacterium 4572_78]|nr:MAG: hypothetical protein B6242_11270 [Anaerolineaceae bacterium 4572_78]
MNIKYRIHRVLSVEHNPFLLDHVIGGNSVLPMTCAAAWLANLCEQVSPGYAFFCMKDFRVTKGIIFDNTLADEYLLDIEHVESSDDTELALSAKVWSKNERGKPHYHYSTTVVLRKIIPASPYYKTFNLTEDQALAQYKPYQDGTLFHGTSFQGVKQILNMTPDKLTIRCVTPNLTRKQQGQFPVQTLNPYMSDVQFQAMVIWARYFHQAGSLPLFMAKGEQYRKAIPGQVVYVTMDVQASSDSKLVADMYVHDKDGFVYSQVFGAEVAISKRLNSLFQR